METAIAPRIPEDTIDDIKTGVAKPNTSAFMYDDGQGNLIGAGRGKINYETGAIDFSAFPNAEFVISATYLSAHSGAPEVSPEAISNHILSVGARSVNQKLTSKVKIIALN